MWHWALSYGFLSGIRRIRLELDQSNDCCELLGGFVEFLSITSNLPDRRLRNKQAAHIRMSIDRIFSFHKWKVRGQFMSYVIDGLFHRELLVYDQYEEGRSARSSHHRRAKTLGHRLTDESHLSGLLSSYTWTETVVILQPTASISSLFGRSSLACDGYRSFSSVSVVLVSNKHSDIFQYLTSRRSANRTFRLLSGRNSCHHISWKHALKQTTERK